MADIRRALWPARRLAAVGVAILAATLVLVGQLVDEPPVTIRSVTLTAVIAVCFTAMAALVLVGVPGHPVGRLMAAAGVVAALNVLSASWSGWLAPAWLSQWSWWPPLALICLALLLFPDGRLPSRRWLPLGIFIVAAAVVATVALAIAALDHPRELLNTSQRTLTERAGTLRMVAKVAVAAVGVGGLGVLGSLWARWRRAGGEVRQQLTCLLAAGLVLLLALVLDARDVRGAFLLAAVAVPVAMTVAVLRHRLYDLDRIINRTVVWLIMTLLVVVGFVALVTALRDIITGGSTSHASVVATGLIAVTFEPVRRRVQRGVNHLLYGERDDPYKVIARLGELLGQTVDPDAVLPLLTGTIVRSLRVPYVAVELEGRGGPRVFAESGEMTTGLQGFDMVTRGERVGRLLVATRTLSGHFTPHECRLLEGVALHAAVAAEATRLIRDLDESRNRLIVAQERERARLWRDLHDGAGSALTGMAMQVRAARKCVDEPTRAAALLDGLAGDLQDVRAELRRLVDRLQPHALEGGLEEALRAECRRFTGPTLSVDLKVTADLEGLPPSAQVAAYRIVAEALNNVVQHAGARHCVVTVGRRRSLSVDIVDDGVGITAPRQGGVGLNSMRERASELGGDCVIAAARPRGTAVRVRLPIARTAHSATGG